MASTPNVPKGTPGKLLLGFSILLLFAAAAAIADWGNRGELEEYEFPTGLQDDEVFPITDAGLELDQVIVKVEGTPYYSTRRQPVTRSDDIMIRRALDDSETWYIYRLGKDMLRGRHNDAESHENQSLFLKAGTNRYLELSLQLNTPPEPPKE
jgi:hypothetical protein